MSFGLVGRPQAMMIPFCPLLTYRTRCVPSPVLTHPSPLTFLQLLSYHVLPAEAVQFLPNSPASREV